MRLRRKLPEKVGDALTAAQYAEAEELGILVDKDDQARAWACAWLAQQGFGEAGAGKAGLMF